jgi:hypothetical protein
MKAPIIVDNRGDTMIFASIKDAEMYLESIDAENNEYVAYDCEGRLLQIVPDHPHVLIREAEHQPTNADELHAILFNLLMYTEEPANWLREASLQELVERALRYRIR